MIAQRLRGLVNLHAVGMTMLNASVLLGYHEAFRFLPVTDLNRQVNLMPYLFCVVGGMIVSTRFLQAMAGSFHRFSWIDAARISTRQVLLTSLLIFSFMFASKESGMSRVFIITYLGLSWSVLLFANHSLPRVLCQIFFVRNRKAPTLFVGNQRSLERLRHWLAGKEMLGLQPVGFLSDQGSSAGYSNMPFLGTIADIPQAIDDRGAVQVVVLEIPQTRAEAQFLVETCQSKGCRLLIYSNLADQLCHPMVTIQEEGHQFYTLQDEPLEDPLSRLIKRTFDIALALPVVVFLLPILSLWVWTIQRFQSPGRLFFVQERTGYARRMFKMIKFRSMYDVSREKKDEGRAASRGDSRIYPFGAFLRRTSIDEFPQFLNVLKGEMSIVGPRPHLVAHDNEFNRSMKSYRTRFFVKPGITGLAQCHGYRGEITDPSFLSKRIEHDLAYVTEWSVWLDLQITIKTAKQIFFPPKSAY